MSSSQANYLEQGTGLSGYEEKGPYHCEDCIHVKFGTDHCLHPIVVADKEGPLKNKSRGDGWVQIDLERGCCGYVNQSSKLDPIRKAIKSTS